MASDIDRAIEILTRQVNNAKHNYDHASELIKVLMQIREVSGKRHQVLAKQLSTLKADPVNIMNDEIMETLVELDNTETKVIIAFRTKWVK